MGIPLESVKGDSVSPSEKLVLEGRMERYAYSKFRKTLEARRWPSGRLCQSPEQIGHDHVEYHDKYH